MSILKVLFLYHIISFSSLKPIIELMFLDWKVRGDWSSDAHPICDTFPISEACTNAPFSDIGEVLGAHLHRTCLGLCPHPHREWGIQT